MDTIHSQADAVRSAVSAVETCTPTITALLKSLVSPKDDSTTDTTTTTKTTATTRPRSRANNTTTKAAASAKKDDGLSPKEKATLATHVVNGTLRALSDYAKNSANTTRPPTPTKRQAPQEEELLRSATTRNPLQRCSSTNSTPLSPLQPRALNRVTTSPAVSKRSLSPARPKHDTNLLATVECARVSLGALRQLQTSSKLTLPELQLETGMSSLIARLITLGLQDQALKELRILKKRLDSLSTSATTKKTTKTTVIEPSKTTAQVYTEILDFGQVKASGPALALIITTQIQALRLLSANKKPSAIEAIIPILRQDHSSSPTALLLRSVAEKGADVSKIARQMETLAQCMISLTPSASSKDDTLSIEPRLSISPVSAIALQALALETRLQWWKLANHKGDAEKETIMPLSRYMGAFVRRSQESSRTSYATCLSAYTSVRSQLDSYGAQLSQASRTPLSQIYQVLVVLARDAGKLADAVSWATKLKEGVDPKVDSVAKICSISAQLLSLQLKDPIKYCHDSKLLEEVVAGLSGPLRGDSSDLDELLNNVCSVRRASMKLLLALIKKEKEGFAEFASNARESLESFVLQCPRFCLRWLGKPPEPKSSTKDYLRYEQRRQLLLQSIQHTLDSAFIIVKTRLEEKRLAWDFMDSMLNDCLLLLEYIGDMGAAVGSQQSMYHVKISHFYYLQYNVLRQQSTDPKDVAPLRALRRSIDCVKHRSATEKDKAQLTLKLERMAELARTLGRNEQALAALQTIRMSMLDDGVLGSVASALATDSPLIVWERDEKAEILSRALVAIAKMEHVFMDWTVDLPEPEQAAGLEHRLHYILMGGNPTMSGRKREEEITLEHPVVDALLRIYIPTRYPIRRLRVLLALLSSAIGNQRKVPELLAITRDATQVEPDNLGEDAGLARFVPHMGAFYHSITALSDGYSDLGAVQRCLETWKSIVKSCQTKTDVERSIDDIPGLLDHLQAMADFLRLSGHDNMVATVLELTADIAKLADGPRLEDIIQHTSTLALQYTNLGHSIKAEQTFAETLQFLKKQADLPGDAVATFHLSWTEHFIAVGDLTQAEYHLSQARAAVEAEAMPGKVSRARRKYLVAYASYLHSLVTQERGESHHALVYARESVRCIFQDWVKVEQQLALAKASSARSNSPDDDNDSAMFNSAAADDATCDLSATGKETPYLGPESWKLALTLYRNTLRLSSIYAHLGMFQETMYYAEQAQKIANNANSEILKAGCATWMGSVYVKAANIPKAMEMLQEAANLLPEESNSFSSAVLACQIGAMCLDLKSFEGAEAMVGRAESIWEGLMEVSAKAMPVVVDGEKMECEQKEGMGMKGVKGFVAGRQVSKTVKRPGALAKPKMAAPVPTPQPVEDAQLSKLRAAILVQKATAKLAKKDWNSALAMLDGIKTWSRKSLSAIISDEQIIMASCLLGMSMEQMAHDPVFSVIHDSTISYPAVSDSDGKNRSSGGHPAVLQERKRAAAKETTDQEKAEYVDNLRQAQQSLLEAHAVATVCGDSSLIHKISVMLQNVGLLLSATASSGKAKASVQSGHTAYSVELGRNLTWRRERKALTLEKNGPKTDAYSWPNFTDLPVEPMGRMSLGFSLDLQKFQRDYIDIIPKPWSVVSISLSDNKHDLCITKLQAGCTPFVLRLPLDRASSRDADNEVFNYQQGRTELLEIIRLANETCHDARDFSIKGAKTAWWADREALDNRMKDLLTNIEQIWLGGFRGIFSQHQTQGGKRKELMNKFAATFENMLDKYLPSRRQVHHRGKNNIAAGGGQEPRSSATEKVTVDPRILELFIGLGDSAATATGADGQSVDLDEELTDLLYFVVDILQFHGERNAYDEIDFDSMVVEMLDALHAYHAAVNELDGGHDEKHAHTILMLDKALHVFPWESLPCLQNLAVSRMPSLGCLRRAILDMKIPVQKEEDGDSIMLDADTIPTGTSGLPQGHHAPSSRGTYILNPSSDLLTTQKTFAPLLKSHLGPRPEKWTSITARPPTEPEFATALSQSDILLYFGHGSGAQYIRGRTIRRLSPCCRATVLLMGCSSARLNEAGEGFEVYGPAWNYMMAGSPAVVGTLWDVTDRDIDRFTGRLLEEWGLFERAVFSERENERERMKQRRKGKEIAGDGEGEGGGEGKGDGEEKTKKKKKSLVEAVAKARGACRFRYVTAAAVAVYGIPVYLQE